MSSPDVPSLLITMTSYCDSGIPLLTNLTNENAAVNVNLATGNSSYLTDAALTANAYLNNGYCAEGGGNCSTVLITFNSGITDVSVGILPPYGFTVPFSFSFVSGGCSLGLYCPRPNCLINGHPPLECYVAGQTGLEVSFCPPEPQSTPSPSGPMSTSTSSANSVSPSHTRIGTIIGLVIGGIILLLAFLVVLFLARRRRNRALNGSREKFEFSTGPWRRTGNERSGDERSGPTAQLDPFRDPTPRSGSPSGWSVSGETPVKVVYSDTNMPFKELPPLKFKT